MILTGYNPSTDNLEKTYLSSAYPAGVTGIVVRNSDRFINGGRILIGEMGQEKTEIVTSTTITDKTNIVVVATLFPHNASDAVYNLKYDQMIFYRSTTGIDGAYTQLAIVPIDVDNADLLTKYDDPTGIPSYYYKVSFYNSVTDTESSLSDAIPGTGYARNQVGAFVSEFLTDIGDIQQEMITVPQVVSLLNECNDELIGQTRRPYRFLVKTELVSVDANNNVTAFPADMWKFRSIRFNFVDGINSVNKDLQVVTQDEFDYLQYSNTDLPTNQTTVLTLDYALNAFVFKDKFKTDQIDVFKVRYWRNFNLITSMSDKLETFGMTRVYKMYLNARFYRMRATKEQSFLAISDRYMNDYNTEVVKLQRTMGMDIGTQKTFKPAIRNGKGLRR